MDKYPSRALHLLSLLFLRLPLPPFLYPFFAFPSFPARSRHSLPSPSSPYLLLTLSFSFPPSLLTTATGGLGERYSSPAGPGRARPPNAFLCNTRPQICKYVKNFSAWTSAAPALGGGGWTLPTRPSPFLRHC